MGPVHSSNGTRKNDSNGKNSFPHKMQVLTYEFTDHPDITKKLNKTRSDHEKYVKSHSSKAGGKLNAHLLASTAKLEKKGLPKDDRSYYFDDATEDDLNEFAQNDPWVEADLVEDWTMQFGIKVHDPAEVVQIDKHGNLNPKINS